MNNIKISNPAFDYDEGGKKYSKIRRTDKRIAKLIFEVFANCKTYF